MQFGKRLLPFTCFQLVMAVQPEVAGAADPPAEMSYQDRTESLEQKMALLEAAWEKKDYRLARALAHSLRNTVLQTQIMPGLCLLVKLKCNGICPKAVSYHRQQLAPGEPFALDLHWTVQHPVADDFIMFAHLLDGDGQSVAGVNANRWSMLTAPMNGSREKH